MLLLYDSSVLISRRYGTRSIPSGKGSQEGEPASDQAGPVPEARATKCIWVRSSRFDWDNRPLFKIEPTKGFYSLWFLDTVHPHQIQVVTKTDWEGTGRCRTRRIDDTGVESTLLIPDWLS